APGTWSTSWWRNPPPASWPAGRLDRSRRTAGRLGWRLEHPGDAAVLGGQAPAPRRDPPLPDGGLLRGLLRGRRGGGADHGNHPDLAADEGGPAADVRRAASLLADLRRPAPASGQ